MAFSLKQYLNESIQSKILFNEILNEPSGFFKYLMCDCEDRYRLPYRSISEYPQTKLNRIVYIQGMINRIVSMFTTYSKFEHEDVIKVNNMQHIDGLDSVKIEQLHTQYVKYFNMFIKYFQLAFTKPEPQLFSEVITGQHWYEKIIDLQNITDYNFKKYTYQDIKDNLDYFMENEMKYNILWFDENRKFLGLTRSSLVKLVAKEYFTESMKHNIENVSSDIVNRIKVKKVINYDDKVLEFPFTRYISLHDGFIDGYIYEIPRNKKYKKAGNPTSKASNIQKMLGVTKTSYCYVYKPNEIEFEHDLIDKYNTNMYPDNVSFGFNEVIQNSKLKDLKKMSAKLQKRYTWEYDIYGKLIPYFSGRNAYLTLVDENGKLITQHDHEHDHQYYDYICDVIRDENRKRYQKLVTVIRIQKDVVGEYEPKIRDIEQTIIKTNEDVIEFNEKLRQRFAEVDLKEQTRLSQYISSFSHYIVTNANSLAVKGFECIEIYNTLLNAIIGKDKNGNPQTFSTSDLTQMRSKLGFAFQKFDELKDIHQQKKDEMIKYLNNEY